MTGKMAEQRCESTTGCEMDRDALGCVRWHQEQSVIVHGSATTNKHTNKQTNKAKWATMVMVEKDWTVIGGFRHHGSNARHVDPPSSFHRVLALALARARVMPDPCSPGIWWVPSATSGYVQQLTMTLLWIFLFFKMG